MFVVIVVVISAIIVVAMILTAAPPPLDLIVVSFVRERQHHQPPPPLVMPLLRLLYGWLLCRLSRRRLPSTGTSASCRAILAIYPFSPLTVIIPPASATQASRAFGQMLGEEARVQRGAINKAATNFLLPLPCNL
jgi:hypothetical protein